MRTEIGCGYGMGGTSLKKSKYQEKKRAEGQKKNNRGGVFEGRGGSLQSKGLGAREGLVCPYSKCGKGGERGENQTTRTSPINISGCKI